MVVFADRADAGRRLAGRLDHLRGRDLVVLGLPRGGVPVAFEVADALAAPLDVLLVRKLGVPSRPELAMGAIGEGGSRVLDVAVLEHNRVTEEDLLAVEGQERIRLDALVARFRSGRHRVDLTGRIAVVVDDGVATGSTARVACQTARQLGPARVILAVPVAPADTRSEHVGADEMVCVSLQKRFQAVGCHYVDFSPPSHPQVLALLDAAAERMRRGQAADHHGSDASRNDPDAP